MGYSRADFFPVDWVFELLDGPIPRNLGKPDNILIFFIGYTITKLLQSALRTTVLPNTRIESGAQNALITGFGYIGIFLAALIAITTGKGEF